MKPRSPHRNSHFRHLPGMLCGILTATLALASAQETASQAPPVPAPARPAPDSPAPAPAPDSPAPAPDSPAPAADSPGPAAAPKQEEKPDPVAARFLTSCSGCHTLTEVKLTGPGLAAVRNWPDVQVRTAVKRMEEKVGPLKDDDIAALADFIRDAAAPQRIAVEQEKMQARLLAKMDPPDAALGKGLFTGNQGFKHGGLACASCHAVAGKGGNLGPDLTGLFKKMGGKQPLVSAIEKASYKIMEPHYRRHPVTTQEALHLAEYFSQIDPAAPQASSPRFAEAGTGLAGVLLAGMIVILRAARAQRGRDTQLVRRRK